MKNIKILILILVAIFHGKLAHASGFKYKVIVAEGYGNTKTSAVLNAIEEAIKREYGFFLKAEKFSSDLSIDTDTTSTSVSTFRQKIREKFKGAIDKYSVIYINPVGDGEYEAKVKVFILKYIPPGISINKRRRIAVYPIKSENGELANKLTQFIEDFLTQTRKFSVLERTDLIDVYLKEKDFITSKYANPIEKAKLKKLAGTDYILVGKLNKFKIKSVNVGSQYLGLTEKKFFVLYSVSYKVLMFSTGQVKYSNTLSGKIEVNEKNKWKAKELSLKRIAKRIVYDLILDIYPPVVISEHGNLAVINMGNTVISEGTCFEVFRKGKKLFDPYTKEFLGYEEIKTGKLRIINVKPKFSEGEVIEGYVLKGSILRPCKEEKVVNEEYGKPIIEINQNGGVVLPGDN